MNWSAHHKQSEIYASEAELAIKNGERDQAMKLYRLAAESENLALSNLASNKPRTLGIIAVSVAALWYKAGAFEQTIQTAEKWLKNHELPLFAIQGYFILSKSGQTPLK
jgi:tetratricopeptide (TPR) repeat protein